MSTATFRRHTRGCVDAAVSRAFTAHADHPDEVELFAGILRAARDRSDLMSKPPRAPSDVPHVRALSHLARFAADTVRAPDAWAGARGHMLRVIDSLAGHLFGRYPTPRFLASVWFGGESPEDTLRRGWFIAHARGRPLRSLPLPVALTRRMEHELLRTPHHLGFEPALRRAEVLGLGGSLELAEVVLATRLRYAFDHPTEWRAVLAWLVARGDALELAHVGPIVDFMTANLGTVDLRGRTCASVMRLVADWHARLASQRGRVAVWPRSRWRELVVQVPASGEDVPAEWTLVELLDSRELIREGRAMHHCVASYVRSCSRGWSSIWSLRHRWKPEPIARSVLTIEVSPAMAQIVQVRGKANARATGRALELVKLWARREGLRFHQALGLGAGVPVARAA